MPLPRLDDVLVDLKVLDRYWLRSESVVAKLAIATDAFSSLRVSLYKVRLSCLS